MTRDRHVSPHFSKATHPYKIKFIPDLPLDINMDQSRFIHVPVRLPRGAEIGLAAKDYDPA
jgi:hypothetical protein